LKQLGNRKQEISNTRRSHPRMGDAWANLIIYATPATSCICQEPRVSRAPHQGIIVIDGTHLADVWATIEPGQIVLRASDRVYDSVCCFLPKSRRSFMKRPLRSALLCNKCLRASGASEVFGAKLPAPRQDRFRSSIFAFYLALLKKRLLSSHHRRGRANQDKQRRIP